MHPVVSVDISFLAIAEPLLCIVFPGPNSETGLKSLQRHGTAQYSQTIWLYNGKQEFISYTYHTSAPNGY